MNITLYTIRGINKTDTPVFDSLAHQITYFYSQPKDIVDAGFYPPYFKNTIKLDVSDYNLRTGRWNYCCLQYNEGIYASYYYYFITGKRYINEDIVEIDIEMDTIQTFMFRANWIGSKVHRVSIPRWNSNTIINRNYIRENVSGNDFTKISDYRIYNDDVKNWTYIGKFSEDPDSGQLGQSSIQIGVGSITGNPEYAYVSGHQIFATLGYVLEDASSNVINPYLLISTLSTLPQCTDLYLIPYRSIQPYASGSTIIISGGWAARAVSGSTDKILWQTGGLYASYVNTNSYTIARFRGPSYMAIGDDFNPSNCAALLDNNYTRLTFGDPSVRTEYPLYTLTSNVIRFAYWADLGSGNRYYNLFVTENDYLNNEYNTIVCNASVLSIDLKNDPWENYIANNKATLSGALITSSMSMATSAMGASMAKNQSLGALSFAKTTSSVAGNITDYFINQANLQHAPFTIKQMGTVGSEIISGNTVVSMSLYYCDDFDNCARYFEMYGYRFDMYTPNALFGLNNRHLFDYVKTEYINIQLGDRTIEEDFENRFNEGLRLWHTTDGVLNCKQDGYDCEMGNCLRYDNIEEWKYQELVG